MFSLMDNITYYEIGYAELKYTQIYCDWERYEPINPHLSPLNYG